MAKEPKETTPITARLPQGLKDEAEAFARSVGVSLNGLLGLALRDFMDARRPMLPSGVPSPAPAPAAPAKRPGELLGPTGEPVIRLARGVVLNNFKAPKNPRAPCPCGSKEQWRHCHGKGVK